MARYWTSTLQAEKTFGYRETDVIGKELGELIIPAAMRARNNSAYSISKILRQQNSVVNGLKLQLSERMGQHFRLS